MGERSPLDDFLQCPVCLDIFREPVSLGCHHSFCKSCLKKSWDQAKNKDCPVCRRRSSKDDLVVNFSLRKLAESIAGKEKAGLSVKRREEKGEEVVVCSKHTEEPKWFCEVEQRAVCHACQSPEHHKHKVVPLEQAVNDLKEKLKSDLQSLQRKQYKYKDAEKTYKELVQYSKKQLVATEKQIREEFEKLHQFLRDEEEARLAALREEEKKKGTSLSRELKIIQDQIDSLTVSICAVEQDLQKQKVSFLTSYKHAQTSIRDQCAMPNPQLFSGMLIDVAKHVGNLTFRVWEKMKGVVKFTTVILDPNTAHPSLTLSDDLTSMSRRGPWQEYPDNPERNSIYPAVWGTDGFISGKHSWEVEVGDHPYWVIGVARESVDRKGEVKASAMYGFWCILLEGGRYANGTPEPLSLKRRPQRIRIHLNCDRREVSFYDSEDMSHICTHKDISTEKLYPCFDVGSSHGAKHPEVMILQSELSVTSSH